MATAVEWHMFLQRLAYINPNVYDDIEDRVLYHQRTAKLAIASFDGTKKWLPDKRHTLCIRPCKRMSEGVKSVVVDGYTSTGTFAQLHFSAGRYKHDGFTLKMHVPEGPKDFYLHVKGNGSLDFFEVMHFGPCVYGSEEKHNGTVDDLRSVAHCLQKYVRSPHSFKKYCVTVNQLLVIILGAVLS